MPTTQELISGLLSGGSQIAAAYLPYQASEAASQQLQSLSDKFMTGATALGQTAAEKAAFKPFAVKTATGTTDVGAGGAFTQTLGAQPAAIQQAMFGQAAGLAGQQAPTAESLYAQMQAISAPEQERARIALENRLQAQGRGGVTTAAYGGTPEQLAMEKAIQEQNAANLFKAQTLAPTLQGQQFSNIQSALTGAYLPQAQELAALTPAANFAKLAQSGGLGEAEALYKSGIAGLTTEADVVAAQAAYEAQRNRDLANSLVGMFATQQGGTTTPLNNLITSILGGTPSTTTTTSTDSGGSFWGNLLGGLSGVFGGATDSGSAYANNLSRDEFFDTYGYYPTDIL